MLLRRCLYCKRWQTHKKVNFYKSKNRLVGFFCQDLEYEFGAVKLCETRKKL